MKCKHHVQLAKGETCDRRYHGKRYSAFSHACDMVTSDDDLATVETWADHHDSVHTHRAYVFDKECGKFIRDPR